MLTHCVAPVPLTTNHFNSKTRLAYLIIERVYKRQGGKRNQCYNNRGLNRPNQLQCCVVIKTLRHCLHSVVETLNNAGSQPQNQNQNNNLEKADVSVQVRNTLHVGSCWVLKHLLPCHWSISPNYTPVPYHTIHCIHSFLLRRDSVFCASSAAALLGSALLLREGFALHCHCGASRSAAKRRIAQHRIAWLRHAALCRRKAERCCWHGEAKRFCARACAAGLPSAKRRIAKPKARQGQQHRFASARRICLFCAAAPESHCHCASARDSGSATALGMAKPSDSGQQHCLRGCGAKRQAEPESRAMPAEHSSRRSAR